MSRSANQLAYNHLNAIVHFDRDVDLPSPLMNRMAGILMPDPALGGRIEFRCAEMRRNHNYKQIHTNRR